MLVQTIGILLVDDSTAIRQGLRMRLSLEPDLAVVGEAESGEEALRLVEALRPDVVLMDAEMPGMGGLAAARAIAEVDPRPTVVVLSLSDDRASRARALASGAAAFVAKQEANSALPDTIRALVGPSRS